MSKLSVKLAVLADAAKYDASCASSGSRRKGKDDGIGSATGSGICHSYTPDGRCVSLLKILLTNYCLYDCQYCINRVSSDVPRARFQVQEVVDLTLEFYRRNYIEGLFLSSGVIQSADYTMEQLVAVARTLRVGHKYRGYIHLKAVPRASAELLRQAGMWADRISANVELPTQADLDELAPGKSLADVDAGMATLATGIAESKAARRVGSTTPRAKAPLFAPAGQSTQVIVGATPSPDAAILQTADRLYRSHKLRRVYYSAYSPIPHAAGSLPLKSPPLVREHRLYQADWLMRFYGYGAAEITSPEAPDLDLTIDPKLAWALRHREFFPVDVNRAPQWKLLRVPGLGKRTVGRILGMRRWQRVRMDDLLKLRVARHKVRPWVVTADHNPDAMRIDADDLRRKVVLPTRQLELFDAVSSARTGEV